MVDKRVRHTINCSCVGNPPECMTVIDVFEYDWKDELVKDIYIHSQLNEYLPWYKKIIPAIRYVLGIQAYNTHWRSITP